MCLVFVVVVVFLFFVFFFKRKYMTLVKHAWSPFTASCSNKIVPRVTFYGLTTLSYFIVKGKELQPGLMVVVCGTCLRSLWVKLNWFIYKQISRKSDNNSRCDKRSSAKHIKHITYVYSRICLESIRFTQIYLWMTDKIAS